MAKVLTGISGNLISAASAGFAPTNSADVSAIASAYQVVSATATQLYAGTAYVTSVNGAPLSASRAGAAANASLASSAWYDGTGRLISSLPDSAAVSAIASAYAESAASCKQDELTFSYDENDRIDGINGSALAGQGGEGIDSATVSAIASSYAESAASGKVNTTDVGVTYDVSIMDSVVTGISGIKISADYNSVVSSVEYESSTTYEDYDNSELNQAGYGSRYASALYPIGQWQYYQTSRPLLRADWTANTAYHIAQNSADTWRLFMVPYGVTNYGNTTITSDIVYQLYDYGIFYTPTDCVIATGKASLNGKNDVVIHFEVTSLPFGNKNGSACWGTREPNVPLAQSQDAYPVFAIAGDTSSPYFAGSFIEIPQDTKELVFGYNQVTTSTAVSGVNQLPIKSNYATSASYDDSGRALSSLAAESSLPTYSYNTANRITGINGSAIATGGGGATGDYVEKSATNVAIGSSVNAQNDDTFAQGRYCSSNSKGFAQGYYNRASSDSFAQGSYNHAYLYSFAQGSENSADSDGFAQGYKNTGRNLSFAQGERNSADMYSFAQGTYNTAYGRSFAQGSGVSAKNTASVFGTYNLSGNGSGSSGAAFVIGDGTASNARHDLMVVTKDGEITMYSGTADTTGTGIMSSIRALSANAGGVDSATVSAIASSYAESAVSSKADSSALSSYALSADVSGTVDLVSTQSANWGGSALALSAGPGVKFDKVGNVLVASTDETLLWSGDLTTGGTRLASLSEPLTNFERLGFLHSFEGTATGRPQWAVLAAGFAQTTGTSKVIGTIGPAMSLKPWENNDIYQAFGNYVTPSSATNNDQIYLRGSKVLLNGGVQDFGQLYHCYAIYGINRTAEA